MLFINGHVCFADRPSVEGGYVLTFGKKIKNTGSMEELPQEELSKNEVIDLEGAYITPGFIDAHTHLGMWEDGLNFEGSDGNEDTDPATPQLRAIDGINLFDRGFDEALKSGVTAVMSGPGSSNPIGGQMVMLKTYSKNVANMVMLTPAAMKFALGENPKAAYAAKNTAPATRMAIASIIREQLSKANEYRYNRVNEEESGEVCEFDFKCESMQSLLTGKMPAHFHAHRADDILTALRISDEFGLKPVLVHCTEGLRVAGSLVELGCGIILGPLMTDRSKPELRELSLSNPAALSCEGVPFAICSDHPETPVQYLPISVALAIKNGLSFDEALKSVTINAAKICRVDHKIGSITPGKDADLVVYDRQPFDIMARVCYVMVNGEIAYSS